MTVRTRLRSKPNGPWGHYQCRKYVITQTWDATYTELIDVRMECGERMSRLRWVLVGHCGQHRP